MQKCEHNPQCSHSSLSTCTSPPVCLPAALQATSIVTLHSNKTAKSGRKQRLVNRSGNVVRPADTLLQNHTLHAVFQGNDSVIHLPMVYIPLATMQHVKIPYLAVTRTASYNTCIKRESVRLLAELKCSSCCYPLLRMRVCLDLLRG